MLIKPSINILVVENDIAVMQRCRELLVNEGHRVRTAESVEEALNIVQKHPGDVEIMFLALELDGMSLIQTLQKARQEEILIMAMSAECGKEAIGAIQAGAYDCVPKTFTPDDFWTKTNRAIEAFRLRKQLRVLKRERRSALTQVRHDENLMAILNCLTDGLVVTDWQTNIVLINPKAAILFGLTEKEALGQPISSCIESDELLSLFMRATTSDSSLASLMAGEEPVISVRDKVLRVHVDTIRNETGTTIGASCLFHDVTQVNAMDKLRSDFFSMVSHELKSPLSSLLMQVSVVLDGLAGDLTDKQRDLLGKAKERAKVMITLVNDILDYRRIEEGKSIQQIESLDLGEILGRTIELMRMSAEEKEITLKCEIADGLPLFSGDQSAMQAIFINLISNAIKYTPNEGSVYVSLYKAGSDIRFKVVDDGIGIPPGDTGRIFEKFYRIKSEKTRSISGSGLGLSIVKGIVDAHKGSIHVESEVGEGTTFIVSLPVEEQTFGGVT